MNALSIGMIGTVLGVIWMLLALVAAALMLRLYLATRASAFLWMLTAQILLPIVIRVVTMGIPWLAASHAYDSMTVATIMVATGGIGSLLSVVLLIIALTLLQRQWPAGFAGAALPATYAGVTTAASTGVPVAAPYGSTDRPYGRSEQ